MFYLYKKKGFGKGFTGGSFTFGFFNRAQFRASEKDRCTQHTDNEQTYTEYQHIPSVDWFGLHDFSVPSNSAKYPNKDNAYGH